MNRLHQSYPDVCRGYLPANEAQAQQEPSEAQTIEPVAWMDKSSTEIDICISVDDLNKPQPASVKDYWKDVIPLNPASTIELLQEKLAEMTQQCKMANDSADFHAQESVRLKTELAAMTQERDSAIARLAMVKEQPRSDVRRAYLDTFNKLTASQNKLATAYFKITTLRSAIEHAIRNTHVEATCHACKVLNETTG